MAKNDKTCEHWQTASDEFAKCFPEDRHLRYRFGFDPETNHAKLNIYDDATNKFIGAFTFSPSEEDDIVKWTKQFKLGVVR